MDTGRYTFVIVIPPHFERDVLAGRLQESGTLWAATQVNVDATAMVQAGLGSGYVQQILTTEINNFVSRNEGNLLSRGQNIPMSPVTLAVRILFNPNADASWFMSVMGIINNVTMLAIILAGAAVVREREHGTMDHLLVMPVTPFEIAMAKIWANGLIITMAVGLSLIFVVRGLLHIPIVGSVPLFMAGAALYLFFATAVGIFLATIARTMPQLGLLYMLVAMPLNMLSGSMTPLESMPAWLRTIMQVSPSTYFVSYAQAILLSRRGLRRRLARISGGRPDRRPVSLSGLLRFRKRDRANAIDRTSRRLGTLICELSVLCRDAYIYAGRFHRWPKI